MNKLAKHLLLLALFIWGCGPPSPTDDTAESAAGSTLESDCESFCGSASECSEDFAADWEFESEQGCADDCISFTNSKVALYNEPECETTIREMWVCVGMIETCEDFDLFETAAFGMSGIGGKPCADELVEFLQNCN